MTIPIDYNQEAGRYAAHRRVHGGVFRLLCERGLLTGASRVLEVGCGTGNYIGALVGFTHCSGWGMDPSTGMLSYAHTQPEPVVWLQGRAEQLAVASNVFDLVFSVDVIHHVVDKPAFFRDAARALRPGGHACTVTDSKDIIRRREILSGYFPETVDIELARYPRVTEIEAWMAGAGFLDIEGLVVEEPYDLTSAQPFRDKAFSSLHLISDSAWQAGLECLERDLAHSPVKGVSRYACLWGQKLVS